MQHNALRAQAEGGERAAGAFQAAAAALDGFRAGGGTDRRRAAVGARVLAGLGAARLAAGQFAEAAAVLERCLQARTILSCLHIYMNGIVQYI